MKYLAPMEIDLISKIKLEHTKKGNITLTQGKNVIVLKTELEIMQLRVALFECEKSYYKQQVFESDTLDSRKDKLKAKVKPKPEPEPESEPEPEEAPEPEKTKTRGRPKKKP